MNVILLILILFIFLEFTSALHDCKFIPPTCEESDKECNETLENFFDCISKKCNPDNLDSVGHLMECLKMECRISQYPPLNDAINNLLECFQTAENQNLLNKTEEGEREDENKNEGEEESQDEIIHERKEEEQHGETEDGVSEEFGELLLQKYPYIRCLRDLDQKCQLTDECLNDQIKLLSCIIETDGQINSLPYCLNMFQECIYNKCKPENKDLLTFISELYHCVVQSNKKEKLDKKEEVVQKDDDYQNEESNKQEEIQKKDETNQKEESQKKDVFQEKDVSQEKDKSQKEETDKGDSQKKEEQNKTDL